MVAVLRAAGYLVIASDIAGPELGCSDAAEIDFLAAAVSDRFSTLSKKFGRREMPPR
jgi:hypothetical protein